MKLGNIAHYLIIFSGPFDKASFFKIGTALMKNTFYEMPESYILRWFLFQNPTLMILPQMYILEIIEELCLWKRIFSVIYWKFSILLKKCFHYY